MPCSQQLSPEVKWSGLWKVGSKAKGLVGFISSVFCNFNFNGVSMVLKIGGEGGIRTLDTLRYAAFPRRCTRPLCDLSNAHKKYLIYSLPTRAAMRSSTGGWVIKSFASPPIAAL